ncbi:DUF1700 domain-containing protein [Vagococcus vulneris]|uniref:DUF1700 domain-containing protein n=1 Tax=Vagococcus vulneris TaxID=1977869 RepID=A0A429ZSD7_9ENTE|nr:DUF1700 domain-containing protein [Vagococcus vulneris]RST96548.1 hypothetical protein CBF37_11050 [Vagococcus vulneris]
MNKEHFLIELKLHLRPLATDEQEKILNYYTEFFTKQQAEGLSEYEISQQLPHPKEIAQELLGSDYYDAFEQSQNRNDWQEFSVDEETEPYAESSEPESGVIRFIQVIGIICLNVLFMLWVIIVFASLLFAGWITALAFIISPALAGFNLFFVIDSFNFMQLFISLILCGSGIIGCLILKPITSGGFKLLKAYSKWNFYVLSGRGKQ